MKPSSHDHHACCGSISRRQLFAASAGLSFAALPAKPWSAFAHAGHQQPIRHPLKVQPVLVYSLPRRREQTSWRSWGGLHNPADVAAEKECINRELNQLKGWAKFPLEILPLAEVRNPDEGAAMAQGDFDTCLMYGASSGVSTYEAINSTSKWNLMFVRHRTGPAYLWYEIAHPRFLRKTVDEYGEEGMDHQDVVVDSYEDVLWRLRSLAALKNTVGKRVVCLGGPAGWGAGGRKAPDLVTNIWKFDLETVTYEDIAQRIISAQKDAKLVKHAHAMADEYMKSKGLSLEVAADSVRRSFVLTEVFQVLMDEAKTDAFTIKNCMSAIMPLSKTTACLPLSLLNDNGYLAFCESDFVVIPSGVLLHYISGTPVFLNDPTYPHHGMVTLAHCTAPRRMDGERDEPVRILTHFESDYGAAPKVEMRLGQITTNIVPDFDSKRWIGFTGKILDNPFLDICRSQIDVSVDGDCDLLAKEMKGFHWMTGYGSYLDEIGYALKRVGIDWMTV